MGAVGQALSWFSRAKRSGLYRDRTGQDLLEYALMAGFIAVFIGALMPSQIVPSISTIYEKVNTLLTNAHG